MSLKKYKFSIFILLTAGRLIAATPASEVEELIYNWQMKEAEEAITAMSDPPAYLLGLYEFYSGNYEAAKNYFLKSTSKKKDYWIELIDKTLPVAAKFETIESNYFKIRYTGKDKIIALYLKDILDNAANVMHEKFNWEPSKKAILEIYPDRESFQNASTLTDKHIKVSGAIGICKFNRMMIASPRILKFGYGWADTAVHEYIHYIIGKITGLKNMPLWLNEGLAKYFEESWRILKRESKLSPIAENFIYKTRKTGKWVPLEKMRGGMPTLDNRDEVTLAFAQVESFTDFLISEYGFNKMLNYLQDLKKYSSEAAFLKNYKSTVSQLEKKWSEYIKNAELKYSPGAAGPSFVFSEDAVSAVSEWVAETARTDVHLADRFTKRGNYKLAEKKYLHALNKDPFNSVILNKLAKTQIKTGNIPKAVENFYEAIKNNPSYPPPYIHLAELLIDEGNFDEAYKMLMEYIYRIPFNPRAYRLLLRVAPKTEIKKIEEIIKILGG